MFRFYFKHALAFSVAFIVVIGGHSAIQRTAGDERDPDKWPAGNKGNHRSYDAGRHDFMPDHIVLERIEEANYELLKRETFLERDNIYVIRPLGHN
jgi:hypothetical protein